MAVMCTQVKTSYERQVMIFPVLISSRKKECSDGRVFHFVGNRDAGLLFRIRHKRRSHLSFECGTNSSIGADDISPFFFFVAPLKPCQPRVRNSGIEKVGQPKSIFLELVSTEPG